jgi:hypothetical protein
VDSEGPQSRPHLAGSARREGHREDALWLLEAGVDGVGDPVRDGPGLARAGPGQDAQRPRGGQRDLPLLWVELLENVVRVRCGGQGDLL